MATRQARGAAGVSRVMAKLKDALKNGNFYEAHQMYRTLYFRYSGQSKFAEAEDLLYDGALVLFDRNQISSGTDLSKLYVEVLGRRETRSDEELEKAFQRLSDLFGRIPIDSPDLDAFKGQTFRWATSTKYPKGHPRLHQLFAYVLWNLKRYPESRQSFIQTTDGDGCGKMLVEFHVNKGFPREIDLFIVNAVLQYLCLRKHLVAAMALNVYTKTHPSIKRGPPYQQPLLNFVWLLILAIEHKQSLTAFSILVEKYKPSLMRDPGYLEYVDKIGQQFFGLPEPQRQRGMFSGMFDSILNAMNEDDSGEEPTTSSSVRSVRPMETQDLD